MKNYFIELKGKKVGPLTISQLEAYRITSTTLIWREGLSDWTEASNINELNDLIYEPIKKPLPPPLPYEKIPSLLFAGFSFLIFNIILLIYLENSEPRPNEIQNKFVLALIELVIRVYSCYLAVKKSKYLGKNQFNWGLFTFVFPVIGLLILGFIKKK